MVCVCDHHILSCVCVFCSSCHWYMETSLDSFIAFASMLNVSSRKISFVSAFQKIYMIFHSKVESMGDVFQFTVIFCHSSNDMVVFIVLHSFRHNKIIDTIIKIIHKKTHLMELHILLQNQILVVSTKFIWKQLKIKKWLYLIIIRIQNNANFRGFFFPKHFAWFWEKIRNTLI